MKGAVTVKDELDEVETAEQSAIEPDAKPKGKGKEAPAEAQSPIMREIQRDEERSLKEWLDGIGSQGSFTVHLSRTEPKYVNVRGRGQVKAEGYLARYDHVISEEDIQRQWGGGTYALKILRPGKNGGSPVYQRGLHRTIQIAGDPSTENLPGATAAPEPTGPSTESPGVVKELTGMLKEMVHDRDQRSRHESRGIDPAVEMLIEQNREQIAARDRELAAMRAEMADLRRTASAPPASDPVKDQLLSSMIQGRDAQVEAIKVRTESELRQLKEGHQQDVQRIEDRHDRDMAAVRQSHEAALATLRSGYEREIAAMKTAHDVAFTAAKSTFDVQVHTLNAEIKRLERDIEEMRRDNRELREKKDKGIIEQLTEMEKIKEAFGDKEESSTMDQVMAAAPALIEQIGKAIQSRGQAPPAAPAPAARVRPQIARTQDGQRVMIKDNQIVPVVRKPRVVQKDNGEPIAAPTVDPSQVAMLVSYLENAFKNGQDPVIVAQSGRASVPDEVLKWIAANDSDQTSGVDLFMRRVANLSSSSPLATQSGRNWLRKVGKALSGDPGDE